MGAHSQPVQPRCLCGHVRSRHAAEGRKCLVESCQGCPAFRPARGPELTPRQAQVLDALRLACDGLGGPVGAHHVAALCNGKQSNVTMCLRSLVYKGVARRQGTELDVVAYMITSRGRERLGLTVGETNG
jgi:hypothetical protein